MAEEKPRAVRGRGHRGPGLAPGEKLSKGLIKRLIKMLFSFYPVLLPLALFCILFSAAISSIPSVFMQKVIAVIESAYQTGDWTGVDAILAGRHSVCDVCAFNCSEYHI